MGVAEGRLLRLKSMTNRPGVPADVILFYGQARSLVRFMVNKYGSEKMRNLLSFIKKGQYIDTALMEVYGIDRDGLDNEWRRSIGAPSLFVAEAVTIERPVVEQLRDSNPTEIRHSSFICAHSPRAVSCSS